MADPALAPANTCMTDLEDAHVRRIKQIVCLDENGKTQVEIGQSVGLSQSQVSRILAKYRPTTQLARLRANNRALEVTDAACDGAIMAALNGKPAAAMELADRLDTLPKKERSIDNEHGGVQVVVNMPGQTKYRAEMIDLSLVPQGQLAEKSTG